MKKSGRSKKPSYKLEPSHFVGFVVLVVIGVFVALKLNGKKMDMPKVGDNLEVGSISGSLGGTPTPTPGTQVDAVKGFGGSGYVVKKPVDGGSGYDFYGELPELVVGKYVAWLVNEKDKHYVQLGDVEMGKAGWHLYFETRGNVNLYQKLWITLEQKNDEAPEKLLMEVKLEEVR